MPDEFKEALRRLEFGESRAAVARSYSFMVLGTPFRQPN